MSRRFKSGINFAMSGMLMIAAPAIAGIESKKENSAAFSLFMPENIPADIVLPEREIAGMIEIACATPIKIVFQLLSSFPFSRAQIVEIKIAPVMMNSPEAHLAELKAASTKSLRKNPNSAAGIDPKIRNQTSLILELSCSDFPPVKADLMIEEHSSTNFVRKKIKTATSVPGGP
jgi:hypothetical protein